MKMTKKNKKTLTKVAIGAGIVGAAYYLYQKSGLWRENMGAYTLNRVGAYSLNRIGAYSLNRVGAYVMRPRSNMGVYTSKRIY